MVIAAASTARPTICPPIRGVSSGNWADTSATRMGWADGAGRGLGVGEAFGKVTPRLVAGSGRAGREADGSTPGGRVPGGNIPGGKVTPTPAGVGLLVVGVGVGDEDDLGEYRNLGKADRFRRRGAYLDETIAPFGTRAVDVGALLAGTQPGGTEPARRLHPRYPLLPLLDDERPGVVGGSHDAEPRV